METHAHLYKSGELVCDVYTECNDHFHNLRGKVWVVVYDADGKAIAATEDMHCIRRGSKHGIGASPAGRETFKHKFSQDVVMRAAGLNIYHSDGQGFGELRANMALKEIAVFLGRYVG